MNPIDIKQKIQEHQEFCELADKSPERWGQQKQISERCIKKLTAELMLPLQKNIEKNKSS